MFLRRSRRRDATPGEPHPSPAAISPAIALDERARALGCETACCHKRYLPLPLSGTFVIVLSRAAFRREAPPELLADHEAGMRFGSAFHEAYVQCWRQ